MLANRTANQPSKFVITNADEAGNKIEGVSASWELFDERGIPIDAGVVADFDPTADAVSFEVDAVSLTLPAGANSAGREIVVIFTLADGEEVELRDYFLVVSSQPLSLMANSFVTYPEALALRQEFANLAGWDVNDRPRQAAALAEAYRRLCRMSFTCPGVRSNQSSVGYAAFGTGTDEPFFGGRRVRVSALTLEQFDALPETFRRALKRAQLAEANALLGGNPIADKRKAGMISETVGESSAFFQSKPYLNLPISQEAYEEVKRFVFLKIRIQRS
jgi:hypothetical protein